MQKLRTLHRQNIHQSTKREHYFLYINPHIDPQTYVPKQKLSVVSEN